MDWMSIGYALLAGAMIAVLLPTARHMLKNSPSAPAGAWLNVALIFLGVAGFITLLVLMLR